MRANPLGTFRQILKYPSVTWLLGAIFLWQLGHQVLPSTWAFYTIAKFHWTSAEVGGSLAFVGLVMAVSQGLLTRMLIRGPRRRAAAALAGNWRPCWLHLASPLATEGWMMYVVGLTTAVFCFLSAMNARSPRTGSRQRAG